MRGVSRAATFGVLILLITVAGGCSVGAPTVFTLESASVDSPYACPPSSNNVPYYLHARIEMTNGTSGTVTIRSVAAQMTLAAVKGSWLQKVGDRYKAAAAKFSPETVGAGSSASLQVAIPSACTSGASPSGTSPNPESSYGEYSVELTVVASTGTYMILSKNRHRILAG